MAAVTPLENNAHRHTETPLPPRGRGVSGSGRSLPDLDTLDRVDTGSRNLPIEG